MEAQGIVEKVAEAIQQASFRMIRPAWDSLDPSEKEHWMMRARAAIKAMREPTEAMSRVLGDAAKYGTRSNGEVSPMELMSDLIDAALNEQEKG